MRTLSFNGRVKLGSVKNFQLTFKRDTTAAAAFEASGASNLGLSGVEAAQHPHERGEAVMLQFGKVGKDEFILDFRRPLSPVQAFAVGLTALARKVGSEGS